MKLRKITERLSFSAQALVFATSTMLATETIADYNPLDYPLLGSSRGGSLLFDFCEGKDDSAVLPPDPRSLVQEGVDEGKHVMFNAYWRDCHADPELVGGREPAKTCGELRAAKARGGVLMTPSAPGGGSIFSGNLPYSPASGFGLSWISPKMYNNLWKSWGLEERPDNFDELVAERYGSWFGEGHNPYPLPGEDPNKTDGGSGRLPVFFTQYRNEDGRWSGDIGITCHGCHSGVVGDQIAWGSGSSLHDYNLLLRDMMPRGYLPSLIMFANLNRNRGVSNASDINLAFFLPMKLSSWDSTFPWWGLITSGSTADMDTPAFWNVGHRAVKFVDGIFPMDGARVDLVFYTPIMGALGGFAGFLGDIGEDWMKQHSQDVNDWVASLKAPEYPFPIDEQLAQAGAILFHNKDLWAESLNNPIPRPEKGNGSCASCHGAYSPRYINDPNFLASPELEGQAAYITPQRIIRADPARLDTNNDAVQEAGSRNFFGYPETRGTENDCGMQNRPDLRGDREYGYLAPPLYGVWASAPYMHNGSIPNLWELLQPADRKPIWERVSEPARPDQEGKVVMGYDTDLDRAYDQEKVGWRYIERQCDSTDWSVLGTRIDIDCDPDDPTKDTAVQRALGALYSNFVGMWNLLYPPMLSDEDIEARKIYNTHEYARGNEGHEFSAVLTDVERRAIIEYMKTL